MSFAFAPEIDRAEWLEARRKGIGGSDAAAIVGLNPYSSAYEVWADKCGLLPSKPDNEAMRQGRDFEDYVALRFTEETGLKVRRVNSIVYSQDYPWALANIDRKIVGRDEGLECKTTSVMNLKKFKNGDFPSQYYVQCMHYMAVTGWTKMHLAVLVLNQGFYHYEIERDEDEIAALMETERYFWENHVMAQNAPAPDGSKSVDEVLKKRYPQSDDIDLDMTVFLPQMRELATVKKKIDELEIEARRLTQILKEEMRNAARGHAEGFRITYPFNDKKTFDKKAFQAANPTISLDPYMKPSPSRSFTLKEVD